MRGRNGATEVQLVNSTLKEVRRCLSLLKLAATCEKVQGLKVGSVSKGNPGWLHLGVVALGARRAAQCSANMTFVAI